MWVEYLATRVLLIDSPKWMWKFSRFLWNYGDNSLSIHDTRIHVHDRKARAYNLTLVRFCEMLLEIEFKTTSYSSII